MLLFICDPLSAEIRSKAVLLHKTKCWPDPYIDLLFYNLTLDWLAALTREFVRGAVRAAL
jgi:hypothetical protein